MTFAINTVNVIKVQIVHLVCFLWNYWIFIIISQIQFCNLHFLFQMTPGTRSYSTGKTSWITLYMLRRYIVRLIEIHPSVGNVKPGGPLGTFREEQAMNRHQVSPSPFLSSSSHTTQLHYTYIHPNLNFLQYTIQILVPHAMWSAQAVRDLTIDHTQRHLSALHGTRKA